MTPLHSGKCCSGKGARSAKVTFDEAKNGSASAVAIDPTVSAYARASPGQGAASSANTATKRAAAASQGRLARGMARPPQRRRGRALPRPASAEKEVERREDNHQQRPHVVVQELERRRRVDPRPVEKDQPNEVHRDECRQTDDERGGLA